MVDVKTKRCGYTGCNRINPIFDTLGGRGIFCSIHKLPGMINVKTKRCGYPNCTKVNPCFDLPGRKGKFCGEHKSGSMINVKGIRCGFSGCNKIARYSIAGSKAEFCITHKTIGMIDVKHRKCAYISCTKIPVYNLPGENGKFCKDHKLEGMMDVVNKRCIFEGCKKISNYDTPGRPGRFCVSHKEPSMINTKIKYCIHPSCTSRQQYGKPGNPKSHCAKHRTPGMIRRPNGKCKRCREPAIYGTNYTPHHCEAHQLPEEKNLVERECVSCHMTMILNTTDNCEFCDPATFATARLAKQTALFDYLDVRTDLPAPLTTDTIIDGGVCGKERPDRTYDLGDKILILECDEHQHRDRACDCEQTRMANIGQSYGGAPVYFIRWNPDDYSSESDRKEPEPIAKRYKLVGDLIRDIKKRKVTLPTGALVSAIYLYYDGWDKLATEPWHAIVKLEEENQIKHV
jgi:hypothetical protein